MQSAEFFIEANRGIGWNEEWRMHLKVSLTHLLTDFLLVANARIVCLATDAAHAR